MDRTSIVILGGVLVALVFLGGYTLGTHEAKCNREHCDPPPPLCATVDFLGAKYSLEVRACEGVPTLYGTFVVESVSTPQVEYAAALDEEER